MAALILFIASLVFFGYLRTFDEEGSAIYSAIAAILATVAFLGLILVCLVVFD